MCKIVAMRILTIAFTSLLILVISGCGQSYNPERDKDCPSGDLIGVQLQGADLSYADLDGVIGADFSDARNVPKKYLNR